MSVYPARLLLQYSRAITMDFSTGNSDVNISYAQYCIVMFICLVDIIAVSIYALQIPNEVMKYTLAVHGTYLTWSL